MPPKQPITELGKPSLMNNTDLFAEVTIAIADPDVRLATLVRKILTGLGCYRIFMVRNGQEMMDLMAEETIDLIITEWDMKPVNGLELCNFLRRSPESPNRLLPIIMLTGRNEDDDIRKARDSGVSEFLIKPFSAKTLMERVHAVVEEPRPLIICDSFVGPDRRRTSSLTLPADQTNRPYFERKPPIVVPRELIKDIAEEDGIPRMVLPDYSLKKKIGFEVPAELIVNPLTIAKTEEEIANVRETFLESITRDVRNMHDNFQQLVVSPDHAKEIVREIRDAAEKVRSRAGIFGYIRATEVATQLYNFCRKHYDSQNKYHLVIIEKHIQTIQVIFAKNVTDDGGQVGQELMRDLSKLVAKYLHRKD